MHLKAFEVLVGLFYSTVSVRLKKKKKTSWDIKKGMP